MVITSQIYYINWVVVFAWLGIFNPSHKD